MNSAATGELPTRRFGRHSDRLTIIGVGGGHLSRDTIEQADAVRIIAAAVDEGVTFMDTAWDYAYGEGEIRMGKGIKGRRDDVFLMTKVCARDRDTALQQLDESLRRLQTDYLDLWQFHEINYDNDPEWIFEAGGAIEAAIKAKDQGKIRYVGFTGHKSPFILKPMLAEDYEWDSCQMPINVFDSHFRSFENEILPELNRRNIACIGMKSLGGFNQFMDDAGLTPEECRRYALSQPITTLSCGLLSMDDLRKNLEIARSFQPMSETEQAELRARVRREAGDGRHEWYKTTPYADHEYHRNAHGYPTHAETRNR